MLNITTVKSLVLYVPLPVPSSPPVNVSVHTLDQSSLSVAWSRAPAHQMNGIVLGYQVRVLGEDPLSSRFYYSCKYNLTATNLTLYQTYCFTVAAITRKGAGPHSRRRCAMVDDMMKVCALSRPTSGLLMQTVQLVVERHANFMQTPPV